MSMSSPVHVMRSMSRGGDLGDQRLTRGTLSRVLAYARPFRGLISVFVVVVIVQAALAIAPPLLFREIIDRGVLAGDGRLVVRLALVVAAVAVGTSGLALLQRWCSSRIGEGLIYDLRTQVFDHVSSMRSVVK